MADKLLVEVQLLTCAVPIIAEVGQRVMVLGSMVVGVDTAERSAPPKALAKPARAAAVKPGRRKRRTKYEKRSEEEVTAQCLAILAFCKDEPRRTVEIHHHSGHNTTLHATAQQIFKLQGWHFLAATAPGSKTQNKWKTTKAGLAQLEKGVMPSRREWGTGSGHSTKKKAA